MSSIIGALDPARKSIALAPDDDQDQPSGLRALFIGTGGDLVMALLDDDEPLTWRNLPDGAMIDVRPRRIFEATTCSDILGVW